MKTRKRSISTQQRGHIKDLEAEVTELRAACEKANKRFVQVEAFASAVSDLASSAERLIEAGLVESAQMLLKMNRMIQVEYLREKISREPGGVYYEGER